MSMVNHPNLPLEVIEQIIDQVATKSRRTALVPWGEKKFEDLPSLKSCALVCPSFLALCRKHIFYFVTLNGRRPVSPTSDELNQLLLDSPHLAVYIRKLHYHFNKKEFVPKRLPWLTSMFQKLVKLQKLYVGYTPAGLGRRLDWTSPPERKIILPLLHLPTLTNISLSTIGNFYLADLASCVNLRKLRVTCIECSTGVGKFDLEALPSEPVRLDRLVIDNSNIKPVLRLCHARRPDGKPIFDFSSLRKMTSTVQRLDTMTDLFKVCTNLQVQTIILRSMLISFSLPSPKNI